jgi:hypothetical protein
VEAEVLHDSDVIEEQQLHELVPVDATNPIEADVTPLEFSVENVERMTVWQLKEELQRRKVKGLSKKNKKEMKALLYSLLSTTTPMDAVPVEQPAPLINNQPMIRNQPMINNQPLVNNTFPVLPGFAVGSHWVELNRDTVPVEEPRNVSNVHQPTAAPEDAPFLPPKFNYVEKFDRPVFAGKKWVYELQDGNVVRDKKSKEIITKKVDAKEGGLCLGCINHII